MDYRAEIVSAVREAWDALKRAQEEEVSDLELEKLQHTWNTLDDLRMMCEIPNEDCYGW